MIFVACEPNQKLRRPKNLTQPEDHSADRSTARRPKTAADDFDYPLEEFNPERFPDCVADRILTGGGIRLLTCGGRDRPVRPREGVRRK